jgi:hypothetical protein
MIDVAIEFIRCKLRRCVLNKQELGTYIKRISCAGLHPKQMEPLHILC